MHQLPDQDIWIKVGPAELLIPSDWVGVRDVMSECGWWAGQVSIVKKDGIRYLDWFAIYSPRSDDDQMEGAVDVTVEEP